LAMARCHSPLGYKRVTGEDRGFIKGNLCVVVARENLSATHAKISNGFASQCPPEHRYLLREHSSSFGIMRRGRCTKLLDAWRNSCAIGSGAIRKFRHVTAIGTA